MDGKPVYFINQRPERSASAEKFIRVLDKEREASAMQDSTKRWRERKRVVPSNQKTSPFRALPEDMPIDYFEPNFYNRLQPRLRMRITNNTIALLPNVEESFRGTPDERLSDTNFNNKYGDQVLKRYNIPSEASWALNRIQRTILMRMVIYSLMMMMMLCRRMDLLRVVPK